MRRLIPILLALFILSPLMHAQWLPLTGPYGGMVQAIGKTNDGTLLAALYAGPLYYSTNQGQVWHIAVDEVWTESVTRFALSPTGTVYAAAGQRGLYRSTDGRSWEKTALDAAPVSIAFTAEGNVIVGGRGPIFLSTDEGDSWSTMEPVPGSTHMFYVVVANDGSWLAGAYREGIFRSTDEGASWMNTGTALPNNEVYSLSIIDGSTVFAGLNNASYRSTDLGANWEKVSGMQNINLYNVQPLDAVRLGAETSAGLYMSTNNGRNWSRIATDEIKRRFFALYVGDQDLLIAASDGRLLRSSDGGDSWQVSDRGIHAGVIYALCFPTEDNYLVGTLSSGIHRSIDAGISWTLTDSVFVPFSTGEFVIARNGDIYAVTYDYEILRSTDGGMNWKQLAELSDSSAANSLTETDDGFLAADNNGTVYRSTDMGNSWEAISVMQSVSGGASGAELSTDVSDPATVYAATNRGFFKSTDAGASWNSYLIDGVNRDLYSFNQAPDGTLYCADYRSLFRSNDRGETWSEVLDVPAVPGRIRITTNSQSNVFVTNSQGVAYSEDGTGGWTDLPFAENISAMGMDRNDFLVIGTPHRGLFRSSGTTVGTGPLTIVPIGLRIDGIYPQPLRADGSAAARITLRQASPVTLQVYDMLGCVVRELRSGTLDAGTHDLHLDASGLAPGMYSLRISDGRTSAVRRMMVVR